MGQERGAACGRRWEQNAGTLSPERQAARKYLTLGKGGLERCGRGDFVEGQIRGGAAGALLPVEEEAAVTVGEAGGGIDAKFCEGIVDPRGGSFELGVVAEGGLVDDEVTPGVWPRDFDGVDGFCEERAVDGWSDLRPLSAKLFVAEDGSVAEGFEDRTERGTVVEMGLSLDADFVAGGVGADGRGTGLAFVGDSPEAAVAADAEDLLGFAKGASRGVVEGVLLEGAGCVEQEAEGGELRFQACEIVDGEFEFDLGAPHDEEYTAARVGWDKETKETMNLRGGVERESKGRRCA